MPPLFMCAPCPVCQEGCGCMAEYPQVKAIKGGLVLCGGVFVAASVPVEGESFCQLAAEEEVLACAAEREPGDDLAGGQLDASGCYVIPGLIDIHFHGACGADLSDGNPQGLHTIAAYEASRGVTSICPASMTLPEEALARAFSTAAAFVPAQGESQLVGINMEGPYISPDKVGAQNPAYVRPADAGEFGRLQAAAQGLIKLVDVAPEEADNLAFIEAVHDQVRVSVAHTCADYDTAVAAFEAGARHMTHLYNAMPSLHHRKPGPIAAGSERDDVTAELIADGVHVHPTMVRLAFAMFGPERIILISDSLRCCGLGDGEISLGGQSVFVHGARATLADGTLAGSVSDLMGCLRTAVETMEIPLVDAVRAATENPARAIGVWDQVGSIEAGKQANAVILNDDLSVRHVVLRGRLIR